MTTADASAAPLSAVCRQCDHSNTQEARFCAGCGSPMWEDCPSCKAAVRIGQKFCNGCGLHLLEEFDNRLREAEAALQRAEQALDQLQFDSAIATARPLSKLDGSRSREIAERAAQLMARADAARTTWQARAEEAGVAAQRAAEANDFLTVQTLLAALPEPVRDERCRRLAAAAQSHLSRYHACRARLREALASKDYVAAADWIDQWMILRADEPGLKKIALAVGQALERSAASRLQRGHYSAASERLDAVPSVARQHGQYAALRSTLDNIHWLVDQLEHSPLATPALGTLVQRFAKLAPQDERASQWSGRLAAKLRAPVEDSTSLFADWAGPARLWRRAPVRVWAGPQRIGGAAAGPIRQHPTRFGIALGLALRGLGVVSCQANLASREKTGGLRRLFSRKGEADSAWGIDAGASALRAVRLQRDGENVRVAESHWLPYEQPLCRASVEVQATERLRAQLNALAKKIQAAPAPVWINLPAREVLCRFLKLPPLADKPLAKLIETELATQFPLGVDQLATTHHLSGPGADGSPRAVLVAAKRTTVQQREAAFEEAGIPVTGVQADGMALHQLASFELRCEELTTGGALPAAICVIDAGAQGTTLYVGTSSAFWFRCIDGGGEDLTTKLAGACKLAHPVAEQLKTRPAEIPQLATAMQAVEGRIAQIGARLQQSFEEANQFLGPVQLDRVYCTGGAALTHGWVRHLFPTNAGD